MKIEHTPDGQIELRLSEDPDHFKQLAELVKIKLGGRWIEQLDDLDQSYWNMDVQGQKLTLHREHYLGVSVFCDDAPSLQLLLEKLRHDFETWAPA